MAAPEAFEKLKTRLAQVTDLGRVRRVLGWDMQVMMPPAGAGVRGEQQATLDRISFDLFVSPETERLLEELRSYEDSLDPDSDDASLIRVARKDYEKTARVPPELRTEMVKAATEGFMAWRQAKPDNDYDAFRPFLEHHLELRRRYVELFPEADEPYDVLLDDYERGMKAADVRAVFDRLKEELVPLVGEAAELYGEDDGTLARSFPADQQEALSREIIELFGHREGAFRLDPTVHPFASGGGIDDIRITTKYEPTGLESFFATMHEYGHGLYEHQIARELDRTPLGGGVSLGLHESQSRMWENLVGRSRPFWRFMYPRVQSQFAIAPRRRRRGDVLPCGQPRAAVADPDRRGRGDLQHARHPPLRARAGPARWDGRPEDAPGGVGPADGPVPRRRGPRQRARCPPGHALGHRDDRLLPDLLARQRHERADLGADQGRHPGPRRQARARRVRAAPRVARRAHPPPRPEVLPQETLERATGSRIDPEPYLRYLKEKHGAAAPA